MNFRGFAAFAALSTALTAPVHAQEAPASLWEGWQIYGSNTARYEGYSLGGDRTASPYPYSGSHMFDEFDATFSRQFSPYKRLRGQFFGLVNDSDYRQVDDGFVPERMNVQFENGETAIPYRVEAGDVFTNLSYRTLQRSLKGGQVELQPDFGNGQRRHSFLLFSGAQQPYWRHFDTSEDLYSGGSWLIEDANLGRLSLNSVHNYRDAQVFAVPGGEDAQNWLGSVAFQTPFTFATQRFTFEGEVSNFAGDYGALATQQDRYELGYFGQLSGLGTGITQPLDYRLRFEQYGADYRPNGAVITADRRSEEFHAGWRFDNGLRLRGRAQFYQDNFDSFNERETGVVGAGLAGPVAFFGMQGMSANLDVFRQETYDDARSIDFAADTANLSLSTPFSELVTGQADFFFQVLDDKTGTNRDRITKQVGLSIVRAFTLGEWAGSIAPGVVLRDIDGSFDDAVELQPTLALDISNGTHAVTASYGYLVQNRLTTATADVGTQTLGLDYRYLMDTSEFGVYANLYERDLDLGTDTDAERVGVYWTYRFDNQAPAMQPGVAYAEDGVQVTAPVLTLSGAASTEANAALLTAFTPGMPLAGAQATASRAGLGQSTRIGQVQMYETRLLSDVPQRQRLVLDPRDGVLGRAVLIVDLDDTSSAGNVEETYSRVRDSLIAAYGKPATVYDEGAFGMNPVADIAANRVTRVTEWQTPSGRLRLGIPRRVDSAVRLEVHHARSFPGPRDGRWGITLR